ncbi:MAG: serine/threonine protein kinase [Bacteriovoracaceae bacterium]
MTNPSTLWGQKTLYFNELSPDSILNVAENHGFKVSGKVLSLNSLENRVIEIELAQKRETETSAEAEHQLVMKFYRPGRWSRDQILEEHRFLLDLAQYEIPIIAPVVINGESLFYDEKLALHYAFFPKIMGRLKDEYTKEEAEQAGRLIGRIHNIGKLSSFSHRLTFSPQTLIRDNIAYLRSEPAAPYDSFKYYLDVYEQFLPQFLARFENLKMQRIHGDFHRGNIIWTSAGPYILDFDDSVMGPIEQDMWLLIPGIDHESVELRESFLDEYRTMTGTEIIQKSLFEWLRAMRTFHFNAWISRRIEDQSFARMFPYFQQQSYWDQQYMDSRQALPALMETWHGI